MSTKHYCGRHGIDYTGYSCPRCDAEERHGEILDATYREIQNATEVSEAVAASVQRSDYLRANPGEYECPHCRYISLKKRASRCPLCHGEVGAEYWNVVSIREEAERKASAAAEARKRILEKEARILEKEAADERARTAPEREAEAAAAAAAARRTRRGEASRRYALEWGLIGSVWGLVTLGFAGCCSCVANAPRLNTLITPFNLFNGALSGIGIGLVIGALIGVIAGQMKE
jgi:ssDNA-binding Zn-finger/Zn-ribbon topoisomerase 1